MSQSKFRLTAVCAALLSLGLATGVYAQGTNGSTTGATGTQGDSGDKTDVRNNTSNAQGSMATDKQKGALASADRKFVEKAAMGGMFEVQLGQLAEQKASSDQVKQFGQKMATDHAKANDELKQVASTKGVQVPATLDKSDQKEMQKLEKLSGAEFDRAYMKRMVSDHKKDVSEFQKEAKSGKDSDVKSFASTTLPTLQEHMTLAQSTYDSVKQEKK